MPTFRRSVIIAVLSVLACVASASAQQTWIPDGGVRVGIGPPGEPCREVRLAKEAGFPWVSTGMSWAATEPQQGVTLDPGEPQVILQCAHDAGLKTQLVVTAAPSWASGQSGDNHPPSPANIPAYATFLTQMAHQLGSLVDVWTPWNEPNFSQAWAPPNDVGQYVAIQKAAYAAIKSVVPNTTVSAAPIVGTPTSAGVSAWDYLQAAYDAGLAGHADAILLNFYPRTPPEGTATDSKGRPAPWALSSQPFLRALVDKNDPSHPPIWITETSYATCQPCTNGAANQTTEAQQADYISRMYIYRRRYLQGTTDRIFWYQLRDNGSDRNDWYQNQGIYRNDWSAKPAVAALDAVRVVVSGGGSPGSDPASTPPAPVPGLPTVAGKPPAPATATNAAGVRVSLSKLRLRVARGIVTLSAKAALSRGGGRLRVEGYRNRKWRLIKALRLPGTATFSIRFADLGYLGVRVLLRPSSSKKWLASRVARMPQAA